jgi:hypothetical protein
LEPGDGKADHVTGRQREFVQACLGREAAELSPLLVGDVDGRSVVRPLGILGHRVLSERLLSERCSQESRRRYAVVPLPGQGEPLIEAADRAAVPPRLKLDAELPHILEVGADLLLGRQPEGVGPKLAGLLDVPCRTCAVARVVRSRGRVFMASGSSEASADASTSWASWGLSSRANATPRSPVR